MIRCKTKGVEIIIEACTDGLSEEDKVELLEKTAELAKLYSDKFGYNEELGRAELAEEE